MSDELLEMLSSAPKSDFEDEIRRSVVFSRARTLTASEARAFYVAALENPDLPWHVKAAIAVELEWWRFGDLAPTLTALADEVPGLALQIETLTAIAGGDRCVCDVYAQRSAKAPGPLMEKVRDMTSEHPQVEQAEYRCTVCEMTLVHRQEHHDRGATVHSWRMLEPR